VSTAVTIGVFSLPVQAVEPFSRSQGQCPAIAVGSCRSAGGARLRCLRTAGRAISIESQPAPGIHPGGHIIEPPVHQIEVMGGLMYQQPTGVLLLPVPPPEIVRTVHGIEQPLEMDCRHLTDLAIG